MYVCVEERRGANKGFTRKPNAFDSSDPSTRHRRVCLVFREHEKRSPDLLSSHRTKERSCDRMTSEKKKWQSIIHDVRALQIFYLPKAKIDTELISRGRCKSTTNSVFCTLQPIRHPPSRALVVRAVHPIWQLLLYCYIANPSPSLPLSLCHPPIPSPLCPFLPFTLFQTFSK